jgi:hypothetical protein
MKKILGFAVLSLFILGACVQAGNLFNPIIGTWEITAVGVTTNEVYHTDASCTQTTTILGVGVTKSGTWTSTSNTITRAWSGSDSDTVYYSFNSDKSAMTVSASQDGVSTTFARI